MEILLGIYLVIGLFKALAVWANPNPGLKPTWMLTERNPLVFAIWFAFYVTFWPLAKASA